MARSDKNTRNIDNQVGKKVQELRLAAGFSRNDLATKIGVTHQQLQKYEKGTNRICASRLYAMAKVFGVSVESFFEDAEKKHKEMPLQHQRMCIEISRNFMKINSPANQFAVNQLIKTLAENE